MTTFNKTSDAFHTNGCHTEQRLVNITCRCWSGELNYKWSSVGLRTIAEARQCFDLLKRSQNLARQGNGIGRAMEDGRDDVLFHSSQYRVSVE